jgi:serine/threonine protein phosphatase PrpC
VLTRAVGIHPHLTLQKCVEEVTAGDRYLISTDGLHKELTLETVQHMMNRPFDDQILQALIDEALNRGGRDNVTGVIVDVEERFDEA